MEPEEPIELPSLPSGNAPDASPIAAPRKSERAGGLPSLVGRTLSGRYLIEKVLGEGGMGVVYAAEHLHIRKRVAVKVLHPEMSLLPEVVLRFEREAMAAAHIDHPNVAAATDFGKLEDGSFFLVLEYLEGRTLREVVAEGRLPLERALPIVEQIAGALARAGAMGIVHRDLKPENVMLIEKDANLDFVKILDFGIAKVPLHGLRAHEVKGGGAEAVLTQAGMVYGTPEYMAPEQALGQPVDARADLYALGVMTYEMLTGLRPFDHESKVVLLGMHVTAPVPAMSEAAPSAGVPEEVEAIVGRLLAKDAAARFADAKELLGTTVGLRAALAAKRRIDDRTTGRDDRARAPRRGLLPPLVERAASRVPPKAWAIAGTGLGCALFVVLVAKAFSAPVEKDDGAVHGGAANKAGGGTPSLAAVDREVALVERLLARGDGASVASATAMFASLERAYPDRADVHRDLERIYASTHDTENMLKEAEGWLQADPSASADRPLTDDLRGALLGKADAETALALLAGPMGSAGVDVLYDVGFGARPQSPVAPRVRQALLSSETRSHASLAALVALDLQRASRCDEKWALLPRAKDVGDARALAILSTFTPTTGCGFLGLKDCWPCLHRDDGLRGAIGAITARLGSLPVQP